MASQIQNTMRVSIWLSDIIDSYPITPVAFLSDAGKGSPMNERSLNSNT